jgi:exopolysaccharide biosynthesis polyprenyl glycosylphosphotransferase
MAADQDTLALHVTTTTAARTANVPVATPLVPVETGVGTLTRDRTYRRFLAYADLVAAAVALLICIPALGDESLQPWAFALLPVVVLIGKLQGLYDRDELVVHRTTMDEAPKLFQLATLYTLLLWLADGTITDGMLGNQQVVGVWGALFACALLGRRVARHVAKQMTSSERCLFVGDAESFERLAAKLEAGSTDAEIVDRFLPSPADGALNEARLRSMVEHTGAHRVIIEPQALPPEEMLEFVRTAMGLGISVSLVPRVLDVVGSSVAFDQIDGMTLLGVRPVGLSRFSLLCKRSLDLAGATFAVVAAAPVFAAIALAIRLDSSGPILFRQIRIGRDGRPFQILKFRTMCMDAEERKDALRAMNEGGDGLFKIENDPRITRVGRILRKTSLDELPQFLNVLRGDMSLVGPRPLVVDEDEQITGHDRRRLHLTPGMTGHWQILGSRVPLSEMVKIDYLYLAGWSLWSDVKIIMRTVPYMLFRRGM